MAVVINGTTGIDKVQDGSIQTADLAANAVTAAKWGGGQIGGRRNMIINGAMQVAQRSTSETSVSASGYKTVDRFYHTSGGSATSVWTISQSTDAPSGFANSLKYECTTAQTSITSLQNIVVQHILEGQDLQSIKKGTSDAEKITLSFYTKSSKTGTYTVSIYDADNNRHCSQSYTISSANTWERQIVTFPADVTGAIDNDNAASLYFGFFLVAGDGFKSGTYATTWESYSAANRIDSSQVNLGDATSNTWQITGVQLEVGDTATPFEYRSYGEELRLCERYYQEYVACAQEWIYHESSAASHKWWFSFINTPMRATPTTTDDGGFGGAAHGATISSIARQGISKNRVSWRVTYTAGNGTANLVYHTDSFDGNKILMDAEL